MDLIIKLSRWFFTLWSVLLERGDSQLLDTKTPKIIRNEFYEDDNKWNLLLKLKFRHSGKFCITSFLYFKKLKILHEELTLLQLPAGNKEMKFQVVVIHSFCVALRMWKSREHVKILRILFIVFVNIIFLKSGDPWKYPGVK